MVETGGGRSSGIWPNRFRLWIAGALGGLVFVTVGVLLWAHQGRMAVERVREAEALLATGRYDEALAAAEEALDRRPELLRACLVRMDALAGLGNRLELEAARELWNATGSADAVVRLVQAAMRWDAGETAREVLNSERAREALSEMNRLALEATVNARWGNYEAATAAFNGALALGYPENDQSRLTLGILKVQGGDSEGGLQHLEAVAPGSPYYPEALRAMMRIFREGRRIGDMQQYAESFLSAPEIAVSEKLAVLDYLYAGAEGTWTTEALDWVWNSARTGEAVADLLIWCYLERRAAEWADDAWASLPEVAFEVLPLRLVAMARERQNATEDQSQEGSANGEVDRAIAPDSAFATAISAPLHQNSGISDFQNTSPYAALLRLAQLQDQGVNAGSVRHRIVARQLHAQLVNSPHSVDGLDRFVRAFDLQSVWEPALVSLAREEPPVANAAVRLLYRIYDERKDAQSLFRLMERALELNPHNLVALNNFVNLGLLLEIDLPRFQELAERVGEHRSTDVHFASTYAFALLLGGRPEAALAVLEAHPQESLCTPTVGPYYAATLAAVGNVEQATELLRTLDRSVLLPQEVEWLEQITMVARGAAIGQMNECAPL